MTATAQDSVLRQMARARAPVVPDVPLTVSRAIRLALTRAAENSIGLTLNVISVAEEMLSLDELAATLSEDHLMIALQRGAAVGGILACDFHFGAAAVEVQTTGRIMTSVPAARPLTGVDLALMQPVLTRMLAELELTTPRTALDGWADGAKLGARFSEVRRIGFDLMDVPYRLIRMSIDFGVPNRNAELLMAMPMQAQAVETRPPSQPIVEWEAMFQAAVRKAPATLDAVLHKLHLPLDTATNLEIGQVIPLPGCTVGSVQLVAPGGHVVARARLGQIAGQIAVRLQEEDDRALKAMPTLPIGDGAHEIPADMLEMSDP